MKKTLEFTKNLDLFSQPFSFFIGKNKKKQTILGGLMTLSIIVLSVGYFVYLLHLYFNNRFLPKATSTSYNVNDLQQMYFEDSAFGFQVGIQGQNLADFEAIKGKKYLNFYVRQAIYDKNTLISTTIPLKNCAQESPFAGCLCMDLAGQPDKVKTLVQNPKDQLTSYYELVIQPCQGQANCASQQDIVDAIINAQTSFYVKTEITQYNQNLNKYETNFKIDFIPLDDQLAIVSAFNLQVSQTTIDTGLIIQTQEEKNHIISVSRTDSNFSTNNQQVKLGFTGYAMLTFQIDQRFVVNHIQYPMITEIFAQFMSIFNILLAFGILAQMFAQSRIIEDLNSIFLKEYYKNTALKLISKQKQHQLTNSKQVVDADVISSLQDKVNQQNFVNKQKDTFKVSFIQRVKMMILRIQNKADSNITPEQKIYQKMIDQTIDQCDIYEVYRDLIKLKMAVKILLSKDQYAALQYCGCDLNIDEVDSNHISNKINKKNSSDIINNNLLSPNQQKNQHNVVKVNNKVAPLNINSNLQDDEENKPMQSRMDSPQLAQIDTPQKKENKNKEEEKNSQQQILKDSEHSILTRPKQQSILSIQNHLEEIDKLVNNKSLINSQLNKFIQKYQSNEHLSHVDHNIYSSLIGVSLISSSSELTFENKQL